MLMRFIQGQVGPDVLVAWLVGMVVAITVHEFAHAKSAEIAGDPTPRSFGRVTLNPAAHYDPIGSTMFLLFGMGWAKPVPINPMAMRHPRRDAVFTALWGPLSNFLTAAVFAIPLRLELTGPYTAAVLIIIFANLMLGVFNLIPVGPLDGAHVLEGLLTQRANYRLKAFYQANARWLLMVALAVIFIPQVGDPVFRVLLYPVGPLLRLLTGQLAGALGY